MLYPGHFADYCHAWLNINQFHEKDWIICNALSIKTVAKQVWFYVIRGTTRPRYAATITNLQIVLNTQKNTCQNCPNQNNPEIEDFKPQKILSSSLSLEIPRSPPPPSLPQTGLKFSGPKLCSCSRSFLKRNQDIASENRAGTRLVIGPSCLFFDRETFLD